jgi:hypothetical protein
LPAGSTYHSAAGKTSEDVAVDLSGLFPFQIPFRESDELTDIESRLLHLCVPSFYSIRFRAD